MAETESMSAVAEHSTDSGIETTESGPMNITSLTKAFDVFNQKTRKLRESYSELKKQVESVNRELAEKNETLKRKIGELDMTRDYLNNILESMSNGLIAVNLRERITTFNKAAERITGYSRAEVLGREYSSVFPDGAGGGSLLGSVFEFSDERIHNELELATKSGACIPIGASLSPVRDAQNRIIGAIEIFEDMTEIKQLEEQVRRADRLAALGEMAATVAHEIRNPLGGIEGFAALLERDLADDEYKRDMARNIVEGAKVLDRIVNGLLDFTRPLRLCYENVMVEEVLEDAITLVEKKPGRKLDGLVIERRFNFGRTVRIDRQLMLQVFMNLILNAVQAMDGVGVLTLETEGDERTLRLHVRDTGCGIPDEFKDKLFMPLVTTKKEGTGLGMPTVMKIISAHNGRIGFESEVGQGTVFHITLPVIITNNIQGTRYGNTSNTGY